MTEEKRKSRSIPLMDYYEILQFEFLSYYFRYMLYERDIDRKKYFEFCKKKMATIENFERRSCFPSIFKNKEYFDKKFKKFLNETGLPNFTYRDEYQKTHLGYWDKIYYFNIGNLVIYRDSEWIIKENLCHFGKDVDFLLLSKENKPDIKVNFNEVILSELPVLNFEVFR